MKFAWDIKKGRCKSIDSKELIRFLGVGICICICLVNNFAYSLDLIYTKLLGSVALCGSVVISCIVYSSRFLNNYKKMEIMSNELIKSDKTKNEFIARTSYELKAPLYGIINIAETMIKERNNCIDDENTNEIVIIKNIAIKLCNTVKDTLDVVLLENGQLEINMSMVDIKVCADIVVESYRYIIQGRNIDIVNNIKRVLFIRTDANRIKQILFNLVDYEARSIGKGTISINCSRKDDVAYISVESTGCKIEESYKFSDLKQTNVSFITYQLVKLMGGEIHKDESKDRARIRFVFSMHCSKNNVLYEKNNRMDVEPKKLMAEGYAEEKKVDKCKGTILIVDNEVFNVQSAMNIFYRKGYNVLTALSIDEILDKVENDKIDLIILDVMIPGISGIDVCRKIREKYSIIEMPILISTLKEANYDLFLGFEAGANDFITKPFEENEITIRAGNLILLKKYMEDALKNEAAFLQAQIKPHFLYNTIDTINSFCYTDSEKAADLLMSFSKYLRFAFDVDNSSMIVSFGHEIDMINAYVKIMKARFGDRINIKYDIEKNAVSYKIPSLCVQPFVENAIRHGLLAGDKSGNVYVSASVKNNKIFIEIKDDGVGMTEAQVESLKKGYSRGVGFSNVSKRIEKLKDSSIDIESTPGKGTTVTMLINTYDLK